MTTFDNSQHPRGKPLNKGQFAKAENSDPAPLPDAEDTMDEDTFTAVYQPKADEESGDLLEFEDVKDLDPKNVWTIVEGGEDTFCDDNDCALDGEECEGHGVMIAEAGFHFVNKLGYVTSDKPWVTGVESGFW